MFHIVVFEPEIPPNTGNLIRLAANTGCELHLVKPLGFRLDRKSVRRAGLDYDELATVHVHDDFAAARAALDGNWFAVETGAPRRHVDASFARGDVLLFGSERRGLPPEVLSADRARERGVAADARRQSQPESLECRRHRRLRGLASGWISPAPADQLTASRAITRPRSGSGRVIRSLTTSLAGWFSYRTR